MDAKIHESVWWWMNELELSEGEKIAFLYSLTLCDLLGSFTWNKQRFEAETRLKADVFESMLQKLDGRIVRIENLVWVKNFIARQIGRESALSRNNLGRAAAKALAKAPYPFKKRVLNEYPELEPLVSAQALPKPSPSPSKGFVGSGSPSAPAEALPNSPFGSPPQALPDFKTEPQGVGEGEGVREREGGVGETAIEKSSDVRIPTLEEVIEAGRLEGISEDTCRNFWDWHTGQGTWLNGYGRLVNWRHKLRVRHREDQARHTAMGQARTANWRPRTAKEAQARYDQIDRELSVEGLTDETKKRLILEQAELKTIIG